VGKPEERVHLKDLGVDGRIGSEYILERLAGVLECIRLERNRWRVLVNTVMNLRVPSPRS
jgi:hypothetical protein